MTAEVVDRQERRKRRTRQAIQKAALELFAERGYRETTINDIAERAEVAPRTVTVHFPAKEELLLDAEPFTLDSLSERLSARRPHESALEALRDWMAATMTEVETSASELDGRFWERRALRAHIINNEPELRGRSRASYYPFERALAEAIGEDLGQTGNSLIPRIAALSAVAGLRELYESDEAQALAAPPSAAELLKLVDGVIRRPPSDQATSRSLPASARERDLPKCPTASALVPMAGHWTPPAGAACRGPARPDNGAAPLQRRRQASRQRPPAPAPEYPAALPRPGRSLGQRGPAHPLSRPAHPLAGKAPARAGETPARGGTAGQRLLRRLRLICRPTRAPGSPRTASSPAAPPGAPRSRRRHQWPAPGSWPPPCPFQLVSGKAPDDIALTLRPGQLGDNHIGRAVRVPGLAQPFGDDGRPAEVNLERLAVIEFFLR